MALISGPRCLTSADIEGALSGKVSIFCEDWDIGLPQTKAGEDN